MSTPRCPVCRKPTVPLGAVDFNRNCGVSRGIRLPAAGREVAYVICRGCGFAFAPEFAAWTAEDFARDIYNDGYATVDPDHREVRPRANAETLLGNADAAMYKAKSSGRNQLRFFTSELNARTICRNRAEARLKTALASEELRVLYQPIVSLEGGQIIGADQVRFDKVRTRLASVRVDFDVWRDGQLTNVRCEVARNAGDLTIASISPNLSGATVAAR